MWHNKAHRKPIRGICRPHSYSVTVRDTADQSRYESAKLRLGCRSMGEFFMRAADELCERLEIEP